MANLQSSLNSKFRCWRNIISRLKHSQQRIALLPQGSRLVGKTLTLPGWQGPLPSQLGFCICNLTFPGCAGSFVFVYDFKMTPHKFKGCGVAHLARELLQVLRLE